MAIARAIATEAKLVIMDEPTSALTRREVENLVGVVGGCARMASQCCSSPTSSTNSKSIGGRFIVMRDGQKVMEGDIGQHSKRELSFWMTGKKLDVVRYRSAAKGAAGLLEVVGLRRRGAFSDVSFSLAHGEILGVTGLLDFGRNELARALAGVTPADGGRDPHRRQGPRPEASNRRDQSRNWLCARGPVVGGLVPSRNRSAPTSSSRCSTACATALALSTRACSRSQAADIVSELQIVAADLDNPVQSLSGGNQQRVMIGRGLAIEPKLIVLHGPTVGVDVGSKDTIYRIIQKLADEGMGIIIVSDDLPELLQNCDRILAMRKGAVAK